MSSSCPVPSSLSEPLTALALKAASTAVLHPVEYAKTLMQLGYEPLPPLPARTLLNRPALALPNVFRYLGVMKRREGVLGLYTGLTPRLVNMGVVTYVSEAFAAWWPDSEKSDNVDWSALSDEEARDRLLRQLKRDSCLKVALVFVTQPLQVVAVRTMAQFIGGETTYNGILAPFKEIFNENGLFGFWSGFLPRAMGEVLLVCMTSGLTVALNRHLLDDKNMMQYSSHFAGFIASSLVYPFTVVSNCMIVSRSGLIAGYPPHMPFYSSATDCYRHLKAQNQLKRGSSLLFRYYTGPQVVYGDRVMPVNDNAFKVAQQ